MYSTGAELSLLSHVHGEVKTVAILNNTDMVQSAIFKAGQALPGSLD